MSLKLQTIIFISCFAINLSYSQEQSIKGTTSLIKTNAITDPLDPFSTAGEIGTGFMIQITFNKKFDDLFYYGIGAGFMKRGFHDRLSFFDGDGTPMGSEQVRFVFNYIILPTYLGIQTGDKVQFFSEIGLIPGFLTEAKVKGSTRAFPDSELDITDNTEKLDLSASVLIGLKKKISESYLIDLSAGFIQSITKTEYLRGAQPISHVALSINLGVAYNLP